MSADDIVTRLQFWVDTGRTWMGPDMPLVSAADDDLVDAIAEIERLRAVVRAMTTGDNMAFDATPIRAPCSVCGEDLGPCIVDEDGTGLVHVVRLEAADGRMTG